MGSGRGDFLVDPGGPAHRPEAAAPGPRAGSSRSKSRPVTSGAPRGRMEMRSSSSSRSRATSGSRRAGDGPGRGRISGPGLEELHGARGVRDHGFARTGYPIHATIGILATTCARRAKCGWSGRRGTARTSSTGKSPARSTTSSPGTTRNPGRRGEGCQDGREGRPLPSDDIVQRRLPGRRRGPREGHVSCLLQ